MAGKKIDGIDSMAVTECEIVPDGTTARMIASGSGRPPIVLDFGRELVFEATGKMLAACDKIDHGQMVAILRVLADRMGVATPVPSGSPPGSPAPSPASAPDPALIAPVVARASQPASEDPAVALILDQVTSFRERASEAIAALIGLGEVLLVAAAHSSGSQAALEVVPSPPWHVDLSGGGSVDVDVDVEKRAIVFLAEDSTATMTPSESGILGSILRAASAIVASPVSSSGKKPG